MTNEKLAQVIFDNLPGQWDMHDCLAVADEITARQAAEMPLGKMRACKVTLSQPVHVDSQGPEELELGPFSQGVVVEEGLLIDVATRETYAKVDADGEWQVNLPATDFGGVMPICFYRQAFFQAVL